VIPRWEIACALVIAVLFGIGVGLQIADRKEKLSREDAFQMGYREGWSDNETERWKRY
jgi:hypothetical protein